MMIKMSGNNLEMKSELCDMNIPEKIHTNKNIYIIANHYIIHGESLCLH